MKVHFTGGPLDGQTLDTAIDTPEQQYPLTMPDVQGQLIEGSYTVTFSATAGNWTLKEKPVTEVVVTVIPKEAVTGLPMPAGGEGYYSGDVPKEDGK